MSNLPGPMQGALTALVLAAAIYDVRYRRIPNWLVAIGFAAALFMSLGVFHTPGLRGSLAGAALAIAFYLPLFALRAMGAGDLKLMAAVGAFTGPSGWIVLFAITTILGGALALGLLLYRGKLGGALANIVFVLSELFHLRAPYWRRPELDVAHPGAMRLPHGVSIAGGTLLFLAFQHSWL